MTGQWPSLGHARRRPRQTDQAVGAERCYQRALTPPPPACLEPPSSPSYMQHICLVRRDALWRPSTVRPWKHNLSQPDERAADEPNAIVAEGK